MAILIGIVGSFLYIQSKSMLGKLEIDDPLGISQIHALCGIWSVIASGLFNSEKGFLTTGDP
jgi:ammonia channel protein AmtB